MTDTREEDNAALWAKYQQVLRSDKLPTTTTNKPQMYPPATSDKTNAPQPTPVSETDPLKIEPRGTVNNVNNANGEEESSSQGDVASLDVHPDDQLPQEAEEDCDSPTKVGSPTALPSFLSDAASLACIYGSRPEILPEAVNGDQIPEFTGKMSSMSEESDVVLIQARAKTTTVPAITAANTTNNNNNQTGPASEQSLPKISVTVEEGPKPPRPRPLVRTEEATEEVKEELRRLSENLLAGIDRRNVHDLLEEEAQFACYETLQMVRDGPGTDPNSAVYRHIVRRLNVVRADSVFHFPSGMAEKEKWELQWMLYRRDEAVYPDLNEDGELVLRETPLPESENKTDIVSMADVLARLARYPSPRELRECVDWVSQNAFRRTNADIDSRVNWHYVRPTVVAEAWFREWLYAWLDGTLSLPHRVEIRRRSFFDGTAHPDGFQGMFIPHLTPVELPVDPTDEESRLHRHEVVDGYRVNYVNNQERNKRACMDAQRAEYLAAMRGNKPFTMPLAATMTASTPTSTMQLSRPPAPAPPQHHRRGPSHPNIYLRPAEERDADELAALYDWHARHTASCIDTNPITPDMIKARLAESRRDNLPFIVAVKRQPPTTPTYLHPHHLHRRQRRKTTTDHTLNNDVPFEKLAGAIRLTTFLGSQGGAQQTIGHHTAKMEVFVHPHRRHQGVARCLVDGVLAICDPLAEPSSSSGGGGASSHAHGLLSPTATPFESYRRLRRILVEMAFPQTDKKGFDRVKNWLEREHRFQEQGLLKGVARKFDQT
ncbi:hypothetical protein VTN31DRAFT_920 [Thermomyces dupontii]|uniref:uncharacterized protein n=1 Tax=Talaromyces thermophilus TaxID=28565 RepID=UPI0037445374